MHWLYDPALTSESSQLPASEATHAKSLRLRVGEAVKITNGKGMIASAEMTSEATFKILEVQQIESRTPGFHRSSRSVADSPPCPLPPTRFSNN